MRRQSTPSQRVDPAPKPCVICGRLFDRRTDEQLVRFRERQTCSMSCNKALAARTRLERGVDPPRVRLVCQHCGAEFLARPGNLVSAFGYAKRFCSKPCADANRRSPGVTVACLYCGTPIHKQKPSIRRKFCSSRCQLRYLRRQRQTEHTSLEMTVYEALDQLGIVFHRQHRVGRYVVDAYLPDLTIVVECQGDYFHCNPALYPDGPIDAMQRQNRSRDERRFAFLAGSGYVVIEVWERDVRERGALPLIEDLLLGRVASSE